MTNKLLAAVCFLIISHPLALPAADPPASRPVRAELPGSVEQRLDVVYASYGDRRLRLDWFAPREAPRPLPAVVVVHGGGWRNGDKTRFHALAMALAERGYAAAAIEYRLAGEAKFPAAIHDCNAAVRYLRANAERLQIDPQRIAAVGGSAGGHLVGLMAAAPHVGPLQGEGGHADASSRLQAAVVMAGPLQLAEGPVAEKSRQMPEQSNTNLWLGKTVDEAPDLYRLASPLSHFSADSPPMLFQTGEHDRPQRNLASRHRLAELGVPAELRVYRHGKHGCWNRRPWFDVMVEDIDDFLRRRLDLKAPRRGRMWSVEGVVARRHGELLHLHADKLSDGGELWIPRLGCPLGDVHLAKDEGQGGGQPLQLKPGIDRWQIVLPKAARPPLTVVAETKGPPLPRRIEPVIVADGEGVFQLPAHAASTAGKTLRYEPQPHKNTLGYWVHVEDSARWAVYAERPGAYQVLVLQGCGKGQGGSRASVAVGKQRIEWTVVETGHFQKFQEVSVGQLQLESGLQQLTVQPVRKQANAVMDIRAVRLEPTS